MLRLAEGDAAGDGARVCGGSATFPSLSVKQGRAGHFL